MTKSIYDPRLRDELIGYTHAMLTKIHKNTDLDFSQLLQIVLPSKQCEHIIKTKKQISQCNNNAITGTCLCQKHTKNQEEKVEAEYILINNKEYLYHSLTNSLYTYGPNPTFIGTLDESGSIILV